MSEGLLVAFWPSPRDIAIDLDGGAASWTTAGASVLVALAACYALRQLGEVRRDRHLRVLSDLSHRWDSDLITDSRQRVFKYGRERLAEIAGEWQKVPSSQPDFVVLLRIPNYFEDLALMTKFAKLDIRFVARAFKGLVLEEWAYWEPTIMLLRKSDDLSFCEFEWLVGQMEALPDEQLR